MLPALFWNKVDEDAIAFGDAQTGARMISLSPGASEFVSGILRVDGNPFVIPGGGRKSGMAMTGMSV